MAITVSDGGQAHGHSQAGEVYHPPTVTGDQNHGHAQVGVVNLTTTSLEVSSLHYGNVDETTGIHYEQVDVTGLHYHQVEGTAKAAEA